MSTTIPDRRLSELLGIPPIREVHAPACFERPPRWASTGGVLVLLVLISAVLRTRQLSGELWSNEAIAVGIARHSLGSLPGVLRNGGSSPLYYLLLHFWIDVVGDSAAETHALSLLFGLATIPAALWIGWRLGGRRAGFFAATLFAFGGFLTQYAEETQPYELLVLLSLLCTGAFLEAFVYRRRRWLWLFAISLEAMLYTQASAGLYAFGAAAAIGFVVYWVPVQPPHGSNAHPPQAAGTRPPHASDDDRRGVVRDAALCLGAVVLFYLPWLPTTIHQLGHDTAPWHFAPVLVTAIPSQLMGGQRVDVTLLVAGLVGLVPLLLSPTERRGRAAASMLALLVMALFGLVLARALTPVTTSWVGRYFAPLVSPLLLAGALGAARARVVGVAAVILCVAFSANPGSFAPGHKSNLREISAQIDPLLHRGDVVAVAQPEQTPLASYYLPGGLRWYSSIGSVSDVTYMNWSDAQHRLRDAAPDAVLGTLIATLRPGQQLLFVRPLTEGAQNWKAAWSVLVRRRAAQWGQILSRDVANGTLTQVAVAPSSYAGSCCVASNAVLYRRTH